jgi:hypothetical protein
VWLASSKQPYLVATSALSAGFDYADVRLVIHDNEPSSLVDFAQESGRAGRDGKEAYSLVLLSATWKPQSSQSAAAERAALHRYLLGEDNRRRCLSTHLDSEPWWRTCQDGDDVVCDVCSDEPVARGSPPPRVAPDSPARHTGSMLIQDKRRTVERELGRYGEDLHLTTVGEPY